MGPIGCLEIWVKNEHCSLRNNTEGRGYYYHAYEQAASRYPLGSLIVRVGSVDDH